MIDPAAIPTASPAAGSLTVGPVLPAVPGVPADAAAFANLLGQDGGAAPAETAPPALVAQGRQMLAALPAIVAATGKVLPGLMPDPAAPAKEPAAPASLPVPALPLLRAVRPPEPGQPARARLATEPADAPETEAGEAAEPAPTTIPALVFALMPLSVTADPANAAPVAANPASAAAAAATLLLPPAIAAQVLGAPLPQSQDQPQADAAAHPTATAALPERILRLPVAPAGTEAQVAFTLEGPAARPQAPGLRLRPVVETTAAVAGDLPAASGMQAIVDAPSVAANPGASTPAAPALPGLGHSFAAVVDRLMAARDVAHAEGPAQPVAVNLHHAEFGDISVRFEQRADGLAVALSSPDPDFARAVSAATPADSGREAGMGGNAPGNPQAAAFGGAGNSGSQARQGQRDMPGAPGPGRLAGRAEPAGEDAQARPRGIFA